MIEGELLFNVCAIEASIESEIYKITENIIIHDEIAKNNLSLSL